MKLPKDWSQINIGQWIDLLPSSMKGLNEVEKTTHTLSVLSGLSKAEVRKTSLVDVKKYNEKLKFLSEPLPQGKHKTKFKVNGVKYEVVVNANRLSGGQYMRTQTLLKDLSKDPETIDKNLHLILANICAPMQRKGLRYVIKTEYDIQQVAKDFYEGLTVDVAYPIIVFFCGLSKHLTPVMQDYLIKENNKIAETLKSIQTDLQNSSAGT